MHSLFEPEDVDVDLVAFDKLPAHLPAFYRKDPIQEPPLLLQ